VVPDHRTLERHALRVIEQKVAHKVLREQQAMLRAQAATIALPKELENQVRSLLEHEPELSWVSAFHRLLMAVSCAARHVSPRATGDKWPRRSPQAPHSFLLKSQSLNIVRAFPSRTAWQISAGSAAVLVIDPFMSCTWCG
jgi:hypothetical protein